jgi:hypothetical protein
MSQTSLYFKSETICDLKFLVSDLETSNQFRNPKLTQNPDG